MKKVPERTCVVTREKAQKQDLIRIVRTKELEVLIDITGKLNGRGAYIKKDIAVVDKAQKTKVLDKHLDVKVPDSVYEELRRIIND